MIIAGNESTFAITIPQFNTVALFPALSCGDICPGTLRSVQFLVFDQFFN
jgi:hypothetical protein